MSPSTRRQELSENLADVEARIAAACSAAGRPREEVTLVAVTKTWPASDVQHLLALGLHEFGESREQEGRAKWGDLAGAPITWHFIGRIQRNKAARIGEWADVVHSVDRAELLEPLARAGRHPAVLIQVSLDGDLARGGVDPEGVPALADAVRASGLPLRGVMGVAPLGADPRPGFERLVEIRDRLLADHPDARWVSAGMSGDVEAAIAAGATHVRLGTSILGSRY
jgi:pyridoxal phosphate enzyme (YggS family)